MSDEKQMERNSKLVKIVAGALVATALTGGVTYYVYEHNQQEQQVQAESAAKAKYRKDLLEVADMMNQVYRDAEDITNEYSGVWHDAIFNDSGASVDGSNIKDFNLAVSMKRQELDGRVGFMKDQFELVNQKMAKLNQPPKEYEEAYNVLLQLQSITSKYVNMADNPTGSLETFNRDINQYSSDFLSTYNTFKTVLPQSN